MTAALTSERVTTRRISHVVGDKITRNVHVIFVDGVSSGVRLIEEYARGGEFGAVRRELRAGDAVLDLLVTPTKQWWTWIEDQVRRPTAQKDRFGMPIRYSADETSQ